MRPKWTVLYNAEGRGGFIVRVRDFFKTKEEADEFYNECMDEHASPNLRSFMPRADNSYMSGYITGFKQPTTRMLL